MGSFSASYSNLFGRLAEGWFASVNRAGISVCLIVVAMLGAKLYWLVFVDLHLDGWCPRLF